MSNPRTIDRRDVAHPTNPIGGNDHVEETNVAEAEATTEDEANPGRLDRIRAEGRKEPSFPTSLPKQ